MLIKRTPSWALPESAATPEHLVLNRRMLLAGAAGLAAAGIGGRAFAEAADPTADLYPAKRNEAFALDRPVTEEKFNLTYNNFYEYGTQKSVYLQAQKLQTRPWTVKIDGLVEKPREIAVDDLIRALPLEERLYRHRCVEAWSMAIPWTGIPLKAFVDFAKPLGSAKYLVMKTFLDPKMAPGQRQVWYPWAYTEGLTMAEATNELPLLVTGTYGKPLAKQMGAPIRLAVPWKYGFKSVKSIVSFEFTEKRPVNFWQSLQSEEYGFWANVNPQVPHPRWSQADERVLGTDERRPTLLFNGYGEQVAALYKGLESEPLWR